jgi:hypothetical protein
VGEESVNKGGKKSRMVAEAAALSVREMRTLVVQKEPPTSLDVIEKPTAIFSLAPR